MARKKWKLQGYYLDGKKSWIMYIDEDGNIKTRMTMKTRTTIISNYDNDENDGNFKTL